MNGTATPKRTLYVGPFVHSESLQDLEICQEGIIGVDEHGKIAFIERAEIDAAAAAEKHGWSSYEIVRIRDNGFFFPGFIGMSLMSIFYFSLLKTREGIILTSAKIPTSTPRNTQTLASSASPHY